MIWTVPLTDVLLAEEDVQAVLSCLRGGWLTMGPRTQEFEAAFAEYLGVPHAVAVSSGTAALHLALRAAGIGPGDEVIVPGLTFVACVAAVRYVGAQPVLCEVDGPGGFNIDVDDALGRVTARTRAIMAVHFLGYSAPVLALREECDRRGLLLIEDAAEALGARVAAADGADRPPVGTVGQAGCFSFFSKKQLCTGEGGMVTCTDERMADRVRLLRSHGMTSGTWDRHRGHAESYDVVEIGFNFRIDEPRAALGLSRLPRLDADVAVRRDRVLAYRERLDGMRGLEIPWSEREVQASSHFAFPVLLKDRARRDAFRSSLREAGIQTTCYPALSRLTAYEDLGPRPRSEELADRHCILPLWASMSDDDQDRVVAAVRRALDSEA